MTSSYLNIAGFLFTTLIYYLVLKPKLTYQDISNPDKYKSYLNSDKIYLAVYFLAVILIQFILNASIITQTCGGSITQNIGASFGFTFLPWILLLGVVMVVLMLYPGFKSAFSDVVGYYYVSTSANKLLTELLVNQDVQSKMDSDKNANPQQRAAMQQAADLIIKICGNTSILINQMVPSNFNDYWNILTPLMKSQYQSSSPATDKMKSQLFELVVTRDNVGEAMWYIYTGFLITSLVQLKLSTRGCVVNPDQMVKNYQTYVEEQEKSAQEQQKATSTIYTITN